MLISQKCQYALRAVFELARHYGQGPVRIADIAERQAIPPRFLEVILGELKQGGIVASRRGAEGGYMLARRPQQLTVGEVIRFVSGPLGPVECLTGQARQACPLRGNCVFMPMWQRAREAVSAIYDHTTFLDLIEEDRRRLGRFVPSYSI